MALTKIPANLLDTSAHVDLLDNEQLRFGSSQDLQIYHDASHSYIANTGGSLYIRSANSIQLETSSGVDMLTLGVGGAATLFHNGSAKIATTSYGIDITGRLVTTSHIDAPDDARIRLGDGDDLQLYHDGSNSYIRDTGSGDLLIEGCLLYTSDAADE